MYICTCHSLTRGEFRGNIRQLKGKTEMITAKRHGDRSNPILPIRTPEEMKYNQIQGDSASILAITIVWKLGT